MRRRRHALLALLALVPTVAGACGDDADPSASTPASIDAGPSTTSRAGQAPSDAATVRIDDVRFLDTKVTVATGGKVTFVNDDSQAHTATGDASGSFDTDNIAAGQKVTITFDRAGTYSYHCAFHPFMVGTVVVA